MILSSLLNEFKQNSLKRYTTQTKTYAVNYSGIRFVSVKKKVIYAVFYRIF